MSTYYIAPSGNDTTGDGSEGSPWQTLSKAIASTVNDDTIILLDGTYTLTGNVSLGLRTYRAQNRSKAILDFGGMGYILNFSGTGTFLLDGLVLQNAAYSDPPLMRIDSMANSIVQLNALLFRDMTWGNRGLIKIQNSTTTDLILSGCVFDDVVCLAGSDGNGILWFNGSGVNSAQFNNGVVYLKSVPSSWTRALAVSYSYTDIPMTVTNTIMVNETGQIVRVFDAPSSGGADHCCFYNITSSPAGTGVITDDPLFIDASNGNFRLRPDSPCLNAGVAL